MCYLYGAHTPHGLKPNKRWQSAATVPVHANVRIINEFVK